MKIGIIGIGRLGSLFVKNLSLDADILVTDKEDLSSQTKELGGKWASLEEVCSCPIIIPCVPISHFKECLETISPLIKVNATVIDVCSVKTIPCQWMEELLPKNVSLIGSHPMFGPDSAEKTLYGRKIVLCPIRIEKELFQNIKSYLSDHGLKVIEATPNEHDKQMAKSLLLTHLIGRTLIDIKAGPQEIDTKGYRRLMKILDQVENDSFQLFLDMNKYNPYAKEMRENFLGSLTSLLDKVE